MTIDQEVEIKIGEDPEDKVNEVLAQLAEKWPYEKKIDLAFDLLHKGDYKASSYLFASIKLKAKRNVREGMFLFEMAYMAGQASLVKDEKLTLTEFVNDIGMRVKSLYPSSVNAGILSRDRRRLILEESGDLIERLARNHPLFGAKVSYSIPPYMLN